MTGFRWLSNSLCRCALDESSISIGRVNIFNNNDDNKKYDYNLYIKRVTQFNGKGIP